MALTNIIRMAASRAMPLAARATLIQRYYHNQSCPTLFATATPTTGGTSPSQKLLSRSIRYFTKAKPEDNENTLLKILDEEIECELESEDLLDKILNNVPENFRFNIEDEPNKQSVTLTREYKGERITVVVNMKNENEDDSDDDSDDNETEEGESKLPMEVTISKLGLPYLEFIVSAYKDKIIIDDFSIEDTKGRYYDKYNYKGPDFGDLDENLQKAFHKYLDIRGINASTLGFLHEYKMNKDSREYVGWLKNVKMIVEA